MSLKQNIILIYGVKIIAFRTFGFWPFCIFIKHWRLFTCGFHQHCWLKWINFLKQTIFCVAFIRLRCKIDMCSTSAFETHRLDSRLDRPVLQIKCTRLLHSQCCQTNLLQNEKNITSKTEHTQKNMVDQRNWQVQLLASK